MATDREEAMARQFNDAINAYMAQFKEVLMEKAASMPDLQKKVVEAFGRSESVRVGDILQLCRQVGTDYSALIAEVLARLDGDHRGDSGSPSEVKGFDVLN